MSGRGRAWWRGVSEAVALICRRTRSALARHDPPPSALPPGRPLVPPPGLPRQPAVTWLPRPPSLSLSRNTLPRRMAPDAADVPLVAEFVAGECPALPSVQLGPRPWASALSWAASHFSGLIFT